MTGKQRGGFRSGAGRGSLIPVTDAAKIQALADEGWSYNRLATLYGVSWSAVQRYFIRHGLMYRIGHDGEMRPVVSIAPPKQIDIDALYGSRKYQDVSREELNREVAWEARQAALNPRRVNVAALGDPHPDRPRA